MDTLPSAKRHCTGEPIQIVNWFWEDVKALYDASTSLQLGPLSNCAAFHVQLDGRCHKEGCDYLLPGTLLAGWFESSNQFAMDSHVKVVVRMAAPVYESVARHTNRLRILQASVKFGDDLPVIDTCAGLSVVAGAFVQQQHTQLEVAELFSGGFCGWSQGVQVLRSFGLPVRVRWLLDSEESCFHGARLQHEGLVQVVDQTELWQPVEQAKPAFLWTTLESVWWAQGLASSRPSIVAVSAPCQPWSAAAASHGLNDIDGRLLLHVFAILAAVRPAIILLEQVEGFKAHPHFPLVQQAWQDAGFRECWSSVLDLVEACPGSRRRFLMMLRSTDVTLKPFSFEWPILPRRPTIGMFDCIIKAPSEVLEACSLGKELLGKYMDPWYMPPSRHGLSGPSPAAYRLKGDADRTACFMAQYHYQHELPENMLSRQGMFGCLYAADHAQPRFFCGAEIAMIHCTVAPIWLARDDRLQMRLMGNGLSPWHSCGPLALAVQALLESSNRISTAQAMLQCLSLRLKASTAQVLSMPEAWILCHRHDAVRPLLAALDSWRPRQSLPSACDTFTQLLLQVQDSEAHCILAPGVDRFALFREVGLDLPSDCLEQLAPEPFSIVHADMPVALSAEACLELEDLPQLPWTSRASTASGLHLDLFTVIGRNRYYFLDRCSAWFVWALSRVLAFEGRPAEDSTATDCWVNHLGHSVTCREDLTGLLQLQWCARSVDLRPFCCSLEDLEGVHLLTPLAPLHLAVDGPLALPFCRSFPVSLLDALGWRTQLCPSLLPGRLQDADAATSTVQGPAGQVRAELLFNPQPNKFRVPALLLPQFCQCQLLSGLLQEISRVASSSSEALVDVKVQLQGTTLWIGGLPADITFEDILDLWVLAGQRLLPPAPARVYSGPKPIALDMSLSQARLGPLPPGFCTKGGRLLVSLMPETRGGGAKDQKYKDAQTGLAALLLERGLSLPEVTTTVDQLLSQAGAARVQRVLDLLDSGNQWFQLQALAKQFNVLLPETQPRTTRAAANVLHEANRRAQLRPPQLQASDFQLTPGYFRNADGSPAKVLAKLLPGASGVQLSDAAEAAKLIADFARSCVDELGVVVLGHRCPHPDSCEGSLGVPAATAQGDKVILHACWHNLGQRKLTAGCDNDAQVKPPEAVCACVSVFQDEIGSKPAWQLFTTNPVRAVVERLKASDSTVSLEAPWGRSYRQDSKPSSPDECTSLQFHCRVQRAGLLALLRLSGHNHVYVTPKTWTNEVLPGFSIIWLSSDREEATRLCLQIPDQQLGLVRSRQRYGVRVADSSYQAAWAKLKPGVDQPPKVDVTGLYKLLSVPPELRSQDLQEWGKTVKWPIRPLRCLGPRQWLVGAQGPPPEGLHSINSHAVLIQQVTPKASTRPVVRAGRNPRPAPPTGSGPAIDPLQINDPWSQYLASSSTAAPRPAQSRQLEAPTQLRFDQQETRLSKLEAGLAELQKGQCDLQQHVDQQVVKVQADLNTFHRDFEQQLRANAEQQQQAQALQQSQLQAGIAEIKAMLAGGSGRASPGKRAAPMPDPTMQVDDHL